MLYEIKHYLNGKVLFSLETTSLKLTLETAVKNHVNLQCANLYGADLRGADFREVNLQGADLQYADFRNIRNYVNNHDIFTALIQTRKIEVFTEAEWAMIGQIVIHRYCWDAIKRRHGKSFLRILEVFETAGFVEYAVKSAGIISEMKEC